jgi:crotonobetainyl-CoA:carnitine CoA-transferase CaiB-like acyl-CoA transferase
MRFSWAPVQKPREIFDSPQLRARRFFVDLFHRETGRPLKVPGLPYRFSEGVMPALKAAPLPGEHNELIYHHELGIAEEELGRLSSQRVI